MRENNKYKILFGIAVGIEALVEVAAIVFLFKIQNNYGVSNGVKFLCTFYMVCMVLSILFQLGCILHFIKQQRFFFVFLMGTLIGTAADMVAHLCDGLPQYNLLHTVVVSMMYMGTTLMAFGLFRLVEDTVVNTNDHIKLLVKAVNVGFIISMLAKLGNIWGKYYSYIDEGGHCVQQGLHALTYLYGVCVAFVIIVLLVMCKISLWSKTIVITLLLFCTILGLLFAVTLSIHVVYALFSISSVIMYAIFLVEQRYYNYNRMKTFDGFLPQNLADKLLDSKTGEVLKGKRTSVTLLEIKMIDYYSSISNLSPQNKTQLFNGSMDMFLGCVENFNGVALNYEGDGVICAFGVSDFPEDHGDNAINAAFGIMNKLEEYNRKNHEKGLPKISVGMGLISGIALFTCMVAGDKTYYTAVTSMVDDCKRIASQATAGQIIIEQSTLNDITIPTKAIFLSKYRSENTLYPISLYEAKHQETF